MSGQKFSSATNFQQNTPMCFVFHERGCFVFKLVLKSRFKTSSHALRISPNGVQFTNTKTERLQTPRNILLHHMDHMINNRMLPLVQPTKKKTTGSSGSVCFGFFYDLLCELTYSPVILIAFLVLWTFTPAAFTAAKWGSIKCWLRRAETLLFRFT